MERLVLSLACLFGFSGIALAAMAGHMKDMPQLRIASDILLFHAPSLIAVLAARRVGLFHQGVSNVSSLVLALGVVLFCADLLSRAFYGTRLLPMLAPIGGGTMMLGWLLTLASVFVKNRN